MNTSSINVVHLLHTMDYGGVETIIINWLRAVDKSKIKLTLVCFANADHSEQLFVDVASKFGFKVEFIPWSRRKPLLRSSKALQKILTHYNTDIIHTHNTYADIVGLIAAKKLRIKAVSSLYVWSDFGFKRNILQWVNQKVLSFFDLVTVQCEMTLRDSINRGITKEKLRVLHSGFNTIEDTLSNKEKHEIRDQLGATDKTTILLNIARLYPEKAHDILLKNFKKILEKYPDTLLVILGIGPLEKEVKSLCTELGLDDAVRFCGFVDDLRPYLHVSDIQVHPSHAEGIPMAILSGMAAGLPIVASSVGGIPEVITHNKSGVLVPEANHSDFEDEFHQSVSMLIDDIEKRRIIGDEAYLFIKDEYSIKAATNILLNLYQEVLSK